MKRILAGANVRSLCIYIIAINTLCLLWSADAMVIPELRRLKNLAGDRNASQSLLEKLQRNIALRSDVEAALAGFNGVIEQRESDHVTLSQFLQEVENKASASNVNIVNLKPLAIQQQGVLRQYAVRMSLNGRLAEILQFVTNLTNGGNVVGIDAYSLRGIQGISEVECALTIHMVRTLARSQGGAASVQGAAHE